MSTELWRAAINTLHKVEGGLTLHPTDPGNWTGGEQGKGELKGTNWGISAASYPHVDIVNLSQAAAADIAKRDYWRNVPADLPDSVRFFAFDIAFHHGVGRMRQWLSLDKTLSGLTARRIEFLTGLQIFPTFGRGWMNRVSIVLTDIARYEEQQGHTGHGDTLVLHNLKPAERWAAITPGPVVLRGSFVWRQRGGKLDLRKD